MIYTDLPGDLVKLINNNIDKFYPFECGEFIHVMNDDIIVLYKYDRCGGHLHNGEWCTLSRRIHTRELLRRIKLDLIFDDGM